MDLALRPGPVRPAQSWLEAADFGDFAQLRVPAMLTIAIGVALDDDSLGVIEQDGLGDTPK